MSQLLFQFHPIERPCNSFFPEMIETFPRSTIHRRFPATVCRPVCNQFIRALEETYGKSRSIGSAERRRLLHHRTYDRFSQNVSLELHQEFVYYHSPVNTQNVELNSRISRHRLHYLAHLECGRLEHSPCDMRFVDIACQAGNYASRVILPVRCIQAGECRHKIYSPVVLDLTGQRLDVGAFFNQSKIVAEPLHQRARDCDAAFKRIDRWFCAELERDSGQQSRL